MTMSHLTVRHRIDGLEICVGIEPQFQQVRHRIDGLEIAH